MLVAQCSHLCKHTCRHRARARSATTLQRHRPLYRCTPRASVKAVPEVAEAKWALLDAASRTGRGISTGQADLAAIRGAVATLQRARKGSKSTGPAQNGTWELAWTTEKETLFILERAPLLGTRAGPVYQVIDVSGTGSYLQNVITFPPEGAFVVDSSLDVAGPRRMAFSFTSAKLKLPGGKALGLPPFGKGWFDNVYLDDELRVSCDSRGDTLVTVRAGPPRRFT